MTRIYKRKDKYYVYDYSGWIVIITRSKKAAEWMMKNYVKNTAN
jgi:hypothetical protein